MPVPRQRRSRSRVRERRSHDALIVSNPLLCPQCGGAKPPHRVCPACGYYKGRKVIGTKEDISLKRTEKRKKQEAKNKERMQKLKNQ